MALVLDDLAQLRERLGHSLGSSEWLEVTQERINTFADATGDHQWIHVDPQRAKDGPFGTVIAHGFLTLALIPVMWGTILEVTSVHTKVNYGLGKVRFPAPVPVDSRVRMTATLAGMDEVVGGAQLTIGAAIERENADKPVCIAEVILRYYEG